jgi:hypothetical protein
MTKAPKKPIKKITITLVKNGAKCPNPATAKSLEFGKEYSVPDAPYWHRRIRDGVVKLVAPAPAPEKTEKTDKK